MDTRTAIFITTIAFEARIYGVPVYVASLNASKATHQSLCLNFNGMKYCS